ncbi:hypothetical protein [Jannaschia donghaensis]|uniref:Uncharacterized protein n=1 Tax=Jannaschia donghaensis TaxID=420998 RepID=A0A0M6YI86_9RHOB|nr:hypothetical protein [Jannaschia donghaensis]CTQ49660.1 hypothetical protein JDO7802_01674 [Jannaschia donghaensis]
MFFFLAFQSCVFAAWAVVSAGILMGMAGRAVSGDMQTSDGSSSALRDYLTDPMTALRRRVWLGLTPVLLICLATTGVIVATV